MKNRKYINIVFYFRIILPFQINLEKSTILSNVTVNNYELVHNLKISFEKGKKKGV